MSPNLSFQGVLTNYSPVVDTDTNEVRWNGRVWRFGHALGALFSQALWNAALSGEVLTAGAWSARCADAMVKVQPSRKSMARLLHAVARVYGEWPLPHAPRLHTRPRGSTVGPWWWELDRGSCWLDSHFPDLKGGVYISDLERHPRLGSDPAQVAARVIFLMTLDADLVAARNYKRVEAALSATMNANGHDPDASQSSLDWQCLQGLRWLQVLRRLHGLTDPGLILWMRGVEEHLASLSGLWRPHVQKQFALARVRMVYEERPDDQYTKVLIQQLDATEPTAPDTLLMFDVCNHKALMSRREARSFGRPGSSNAADGEWNRADKWHQAVYFWACAAQHPYSCQAMAVNYAYLWQTRWLAGDVSALTHAINWYRIGEEWCRRTQLQHDNAWDFIMFGELFKKGRSQASSATLSY